MKKVYLVSVAVLALGLSSCGNKSAQKQATDVVEEASVVLETVPVGDTSKTSLDYLGTYEGVLPTASGEGRKINITLADDSLYTMVSSYVGKNLPEDKESGIFRWNAEGTQITLLGDELPNRYQVGENQLIALDMDGKKVEGPLADMQILKKISPTK